MISRCLERRRRRRALVSPIGAFILAAIVSAANPTFMTSGREAILMKIYEREHPTTGAFVKDGVLYRVDRSGSVTANANDGLMVDKNGGIWIIVPQKDDATLIKEKYYMGQIEDVPTLPKNPSAAEQKQYDEYMNKLFDFDKLPICERFRMDRFRCRCERRRRSFCARVASRRDGRGRGRRSVVGFAIGNSHALTVRIVCNVSVCYVYALTTLSLSI